MGVLIIVLLALLIPTGLTFCAGWAFAEGMVWASVALVFVAWIVGYGLNHALEKDERPAGRFR